MHSKQLKTVAPRDQGGDPGPIADQRPPRPDYSEVTIYEPTFGPKFELTEPGRASLRVVDNSQAHWREFRLLVDFWRRGDHRKAARSGIFSPKFRLKTQIRDDEFLAFAKANPDADICIINPSPNIAYRSYNVWMQGEQLHPDITVRAQRLLDASGISWDLSKVPRHDHSNLCYCNFWVATPRFWNDYVGGVLDRIAVFLEDNPSHPITRSVMEETIYIPPTPFLPFIVERLLSTYLSLHPTKVAAYPTHLNLPRYCRTSFEREVVAFMQQRIDLADSGGRFGPELIEMQDFMGRLVRRHHRTYYATHPHPNAGVVIPQSDPDAP